MEGELSGPPHRKGNATYDSIGSLHANDYTDKGSSPYEVNRGNVPFSAEIDAMVDKPDECSKGCCTC